MSKTIIIALIMLVTVLVAGFIYRTYIPEKVTTTNKAGATFTWSQESYVTEFIPRTIISLNAKYTDGTVQTKVVEDIDGGCNAYETKDADVYPKSDMIICYYAGFGRYYKVVETSRGFDVKRKEFDEGSPEFTPLIFPFETIRTF